MQMLMSCWSPPSLFSTIKRDLVTSHGIAEEKIIPLFSNPNEISMKDKIMFRARDIDIYKPPRVDCHLHTSWTDGDASVSEVYEASVSAKLSSSVQ